MKVKICCIFVFVSSLIFAQTPNGLNLNAGIRIQKTQNLYWENGLSLDFSHKKIVDNKIHIKLSYVSSRLGNALFGNAIKQDNYIVGVDFRFLSQKPFNIYAGINTGFFHADMEEPMFDILPHNSLLLSVEGGLSYRFKFPLLVNLGIGYNVISGDGVNAPGTLFPIFYQTSLFYQIKR